VTKLNSKIKNTAGLLNINFDYCGNWFISPPVSLYHISMSSYMMFAISQNLICVNSITNLNRLVDYLMS
jgi:glutaredoxin 2